MAVKPDTVSRILDGAIAALARQGPKKFSMSDICDEAGIARGTLYRYFKNKDEVLEAIGDHVTRGLSEAIQAGIEARPDRRDRIAVVLDSMVSFWHDNPETVLLGQLEPGFTLEYITRTIPNFRPLLHTVLDPVLSESAIVKQGVATEDQLIDLLLRVIFSHYYMPLGDTDRLAEWAILSTLGREPGESLAKSRRGRIAS